RRFFTFRRRRGALRGSCGFGLLGLPFLNGLGRTRLLSILAFVVLFLSDFLRVCDVARISHQLIDDSQMQTGRIWQGNRSHRLSQALPHSEARSCGEVCDLTMCTVIDLIYAKLISRSKNIESN